MICQFAIRTTTTPNTQDGTFSSGGATNNWWHLRQNCALRIAGLPKPMGAKWTAATHGAPARLFRLMFATSKYRVGTQRDAEKTRSFPDPLWQSVASETAMCVIASRGHRNRLISYCPFAATCRLLVYCVSYAAFATI